MAKNNNLDDFLRDIASEIRAQNSSINSINPQDFVDLILPKTNVEKKDINFYDFDGRLLYSYTLEEASTLEELPPLPVSNNKYCIPDSWNFTLAQIKEQENKCDVGCTYYVKNASKCYILDIPKYTTIKVTIYENISATIRWGHLNSTQPISQSGTYSYNYPAGIYCLEIDHYHDTDVIINKPEYVKEVYLQDVNWRGCNGYKTARRFVVSSCDLNDATSGNISFNNSSASCLVIPKHVEVLGHVAQECFKYSHIKKIILPCPTPGATLYSDMFAYSDVEEITLPKGYNYIFSYCFFYCEKLKSVYFGPDVISIGDRSFRENPKLELLDFSCAKTVVELGSNCSFNSNVKIVVPDHLYDNWIANSGWSSFSNRIVKVSEYYAS